MIRVALPTLHADQVRAYRFIRENRLVALRCGRRWGKTALDITLAADDAVKRRFVGWFAPEYKFVAEAYRELATILDPVKKSSSKDGVFQTITGGRIDFWSLENELAGRSRKYHRVIIDEGAFTKPEMLDVWRKNIRPTLLDYGGSAVVTSNTNGEDSENFLWQICNQPEHGFVDFHAPTHNNPLLPIREPGESLEVWQARREEVLAKLQKENAPLVYAQEYLAEFINWLGVAFFSRDKLLVDGKPVVYPKICDAVFATIDSATKTGKENDGTGVVYWAYSSREYGAPPLVALDWDLQQIEGASLETWLPDVFKNLEAFARECRARNGSQGAFIEDKASGMVLLQQANRRGWPVHAIDSRLTAAGKTERALAASPYVYQNKVKLSRAAYDRVINYKGVTRNHLLGQITGFRVGVKDQVEDDLLDCFTYSVVLALGNNVGM